MSKRNKVKVVKPDITKLCKDCKFCDTPKIMSPFCLKSEGIDLVTGEKEYEKARTMRSTGECGPSGKFFIKK